MQQNANKENLITDREKIIYMIRHGETDLNKKGIVQGRGMDTDLNATGLKQANSFFDAYHHLKFDKIYTSTLKRTHQTIKKFVEKGIAWEQLEGLDELAWGILEGRDTDEFTRSSFKKLIESWASGNYDEKIEGGESPNDVIKRQKIAMDYIVSKTNEKLILVCMHGRAMRLMLSIIMNKPMSKMDDFPHQNTSLYKLQYDGKAFKILLFNDLSHLTFS